MSDNRQGNYQPLLTTGLAIALGATLMTVVGSNDATAYPSGAVSYGANPIVSVGGSISSGDVISPITAPTGSDLIISDVFLSWREVLLHRVVPNLLVDLDLIQNFLLYVRVQLDFLIHVILYLVDISSEQFFLIAFIEGRFKNFVTRCFVVVSEVT